MSVTKLHNNNKLVSIKVDISSETVSHRSSLCSCLGCDSIGCFAKRHNTVKKGCQCVICKDFRNCLALPKELNQEKEAVKLKDSASKKVIRETVTKETIKSIKKGAKTMYEFYEKEIFGKNLEKRPNICNENDRFSSKSSESNKIPINNIENNIEKIVEKECTQPVVQGPNTHIDLLPEDDNFVTMLSAQVMDVPYKDFQESDSPDLLSLAKPSSKVNIFKRIKEIYDACSCKVCECISTKPFQSGNEICNCKPCECPDCVSVRRDIEKNIRHTPHSGCPCVRCDRKDCRGVVKQHTSVPQLCDCSDASEDVGKPCDCEPCQCINCKLLNNLKPKTARMLQLGDIFQKETCQCAPCECVECKQIYNRTNPIVMCSTSTNPAIVNTCRCEDCYNECCQVNDLERCTCETYNSTVKKTYQTNCNDYDVRTVIVDSKGYSKQHSIFDNNNTIALFATVENNNPTYLKEKELCKCVDCECIVCNGKDEMLRKKRGTPLKSHANYSHNPSILPTPAMNACQCTPCECEICSRKSREDSAIIQSKCKCDICDCIDCDNTYFPACSVAAREMVKPIKAISMNNKCDCHPCECKNCDTLFSCTNYSGVKFYSGGKSCRISKSTRRLRKVMLVSPCTSETYLNTEETHNKCESISAEKSPRKPTQTTLTTYTSKDIYQLNQVPLLQTLKNELDQNFESNMNSMSGENYYTALESDVLLNVNNSALKPRSCTSVKKESMLSPCNDLNTTNETTNNIQNTQTEAKSLNYIHESPFKVIFRNSEDSIPMFWICPNESSHLSGITQDVKSSSTIPVYSPVNHLSNLRSTKYSSSKPGIASSSRIGSYDSCERISNIEPNLGVLDSGNSYFKYFGNPNYIRNFDYNINNEHNVLCLESHKYTDPFCKSVKNESLVNHADLTVSYEKATKVLQEAKAFSIKLVKMLDSFEKANRDFESASQKFKNLHNSLLVINEDYNNMNKYECEVPENSNEKDENEPEKEYEQCIKPLESDNLKNNQNVKSFTIETLDVNYYNKIIPNSANLTVQNNEVKPVHECPVKKEAYSVHKLKEVISSKSTKKMLKNNKISSLPVAIAKDFEENNLSQTHSANKPTNQDHSNEKAPRLKDRTVPKEKQQKSFPVTQEITSIYGNNTMIDNAETDETHKKIDEYAKKGDKKSWDILRKNLDLGTLPERRKIIMGAPTLELDIKEAIGAIALQVSNQEKISKPFNRAKEALSRLMSEVNKVLTMPSLQPNLQVQNDADIKDLDHKSRCSAASSQTYDFVVAKADKEVYFNSQESAELQKDFYKGKRYNGVNRSEANVVGKAKVKSAIRTKQLSEDISLNIRQSKSNCEAFKASFVGLRRVSDHTVLVKWDLPKRVDDVQGYELLVDGRAVQTIFSRTRRMAVVTCLPPTDRVLLTIRTLATRPHAGHSPAASVVYRPRVK